jgi:hypothetical protein
MSQGEVLPATLLVPHRGPRVKRQVMLAGRSGAVGGLPDRAIAGQC